MAVSVSLKGIEVSISSAAACAGLIARAGYTHMDLDNDCNGYTLLCIKANGHTRVFRGKTADDAFNKAIDKFVDILKIGEKA